MIHLFDTMYAIMIQDKLRLVEKELTRLRSGQEKEHDPAADIV